VEAAGRLAHDAPVTAPPPPPASPAPVPPAAYPPGLVAVLGVQFLNGLGFGLVFPVVALYGESTGLSPAQITLLVALHPLMRLLGGPAWGRLADRFGRRPVLLAGVAIQAVGHLAFALLVGPLGLGLARALTGLGAGDAVAAAAVVADTTGEGDRARGLGLLRAAGGLGLLSGPVVGGLLGLGGLQWPGYGAALACVLSLVVVWRRCPETRPAAAAPAAASTFGARPRGLAVPLPALLIAVAAAGAMAQAESIVPLAIEHVLVPTLELPGGLLPAQAAMLLTVGVILCWGLTTAIFDGALSARLVNRLTELWGLRLGLLLWAIAFACTPPVYVAGLLPGALVIALTAVPVSVAGVSLATWISKRAGAEGQGRALGLAQSAQAAGEFIGPAAAGALYELRYGLPYEVGAVVLLGALGLSFGLRPRVARG
jgi:DHA1 family tetracycline resistance protein-like MFS transporter